MVVLAVDLDSSVRVRAREHEERRAGQNMKRAGHTHAFSKRPREVGRGAFDKRYSSSSLVDTMLHANHRSVLCRAMGLNLAWLILIIDGSWFTTLGILGSSRLGLAWVRCSAARVQMDCFFGGGGSEGGRDGEGRGGRMAGRQAIRQTVSLSVSRVVVQEEDDDMGWEGEGKGSRAGEGQLGHQRERASIHAGLANERRV